MRKFGLIGIAVFLFCVLQNAFAQDVSIREVPVVSPARGAGTWRMDALRLFQDDVNERLAKANLAVHQEGEMLYEFNVRYEGGAEDGHGGVGIHIFGDSVLNAPSWGSGKSYLLWLNYDEKPVNRGIPAGLSAQVYKSVSHSDMRLLHSVSLNEYLPLLDDDALSRPIPFRIVVNATTGEVRVYDPSVDLSSVYYVFHIEKSDLPLKGEWIALRTNGLKASFARGL